MCLSPQMIKNKKNSCLLLNFKNDNNMISKINNKIVARNKNNLLFPKKNTFMKATNNNLFHNVNKKLLSDFSFKNFLYNNKQVKTKKNFETPRGNNNLSLSKLINNNKNNYYFSFLSNNEKNIIYNFSNEHSQIDSFSQRTVKDSSELKINSKYIKRSSSLINFQNIPAKKILSNNSNYVNSYFSKNKKTNFYFKKLNKRGFFDKLKINKNSIKTPRSSSCKNNYIDNNDNNSLKLRKAFIKKNNEDFVETNYSINENNNTILMPEEIHFKSVKCFQEIKKGSALID